MRRVLIVAYYFPPIGGIGSIRLARFAEYLPQFGWEPLVLAPRDTPHPHDARLRYPEDRVIRTHSIELSRAGRALPGGTKPEATPRARRLREAVRGAAYRYMYFPDAQVG